MRPVHLARIGLIVASTLLLAQSSPSSFNQKHSASAPRYTQASPIGHNANKNVVHPAESSQAQALSFANPVSYGSGGVEVSAVAAADLTGNGKLDLVVAGSECGANSCTANLAVLLGNGDGTFQAAVTYASGGYGGAYSVAVADVNGDGKPDLVVANECLASNCATDGSVSVLLGNGDGTFQAAVIYDSGGMDALSVAVADMNGDGKPDIVVANFCANQENCDNYGDGSVGVLLGNGDGTFQPAVTYDSGGWGSSDLAVGDLTGNGNADVVLAQCGAPGFGCAPGEIVVLLGNGDGTLQTAVIYSSGEDEPHSMALADVNGDGKLDVVVANGASLPSEHGNAAVSVLLGNGDGTFQTPTSYYLGALGVPYLAVADVNGDGKPDVVVTDLGGSCANGGSNPVAVMLGNGDGTFQSPVGFCTSPNGSYGPIAVANLNGDGKPDLIVGVGSTVNILINTSAITLLSPTSLNFSNQNLGTTSAPQTVTFTNTGNFTTTVDISSIGVTGANSTEFGQTNTCGSSLPPGQSCTINVTFTPTVPGNASASLNIADNIAGSPQIVPLTGFGNGPTVSLSPTSVSFSGQYVGTSGLPQTVTLTNTGSAALTITSVTASPSDFGVLNACGSSVAIGASCSIGVFFDPTTSGARSGTLTVTDNATNSPQTVPLSGTGQDFSMAPSGPSSATVSPGQTAKYTVAVTPAGGFKQTVTLSCSGAPGGSTCSVSPDSVALNGSTPASASVTVTTAGSSASLMHPYDFRSAGSRLALWLALPGLSGLVFFAGSGGRTRKQHSWRLYGLVFLCLFCVAVTWSACGGGSSSSSGGGTPEGTYTVTVTGTFTSGSATLTHTTKLTLVVQ